MEIQLQDYTYKVDKYKVIHQDNPDPFTYDEKYIQSINSFNQKDKDVLTYNRLGFIFNSMGYVPESLMDIGYGDGSFLEIAKGLIDKCTGYDITGLGLPKGCRKIKELDKSKEFFDVVTMWDSLINIPNMEFIFNLNCQYIALTVPNCHYKSKEWFEKKYIHRKPNENLHHFSKQSLCDFMFDFGYNLIDMDSEDLIRTPYEFEQNIIMAVFEKRSDLIWHKKTS